MVHDISELKKCVELLERIEFEISILYDIKLSDVRSKMISLRDSGSMISNEFTNSWLEIYSIFERLSDELLTDDTEDEAFSDS